MLDKYNRRINYLRISVTDRCNLRCQYCMPEDGIELFSHNDTITFEEIINVVKIGVKLGVDKVRLTGGEPLVRKGIIDLIAMISKIEGIKDLAMTTNGILLEKYAKELYAAGLKRINISLDTVDPVRYKELSRGGDLSQALQGIQTAKKVGFDPIKVNCVVWKSKEEGDAQGVKKYCEENGLQIRYIRWMNLNTGEFSVVEGGAGGDCMHCNRLRITSNGIIKPCLFSDIGYSIREYGIEEAFRCVIDEKPQCGTSSQDNKFYNIGG